MTKTLEQAIERLRQMPDDRQDSIARLVLHEIEEDERWAKSTEAHSGKLKALVEEISHADGRGEYPVLDPDEL